MRRARAGISDPDRPTGSFLFLGPTGVGKTELAKALADFLFDDERAIVRIDMSEYSEKHSVARLVGAPPGYVGYEEGGQLTEAVRRRPYCVVLLDEVEKAHPRGLRRVVAGARRRSADRWSGSYGRLPQHHLDPDVEPGIDVPHRSDTRRRRPARRGDGAGAGTFKPEFLNRLDEVILFDPLGTDELTQIVDLQIARLQARLADRRLTLSVTPAALEWLALTGFDPLYGARPLRRLVQSAIGDQLARGLLSGEIRDGETVTGRRGRVQGRARRPRRLEQ